jgi:hypothetical protein
MGGFIVRRQPIGAEPVSLVGFFRWRVLDVSEGWLFCGERGTRRLDGGRRF